MLKLLYFTYSCKYLKFKMVHILPSFFFLENPDEIKSPFSATFNDNSFFPEFVSNL